MDLSDFCIVLTTAGAEAEAEAIAQALVERRLAACVQIHPVTSRYAWKGVTERASEWALSIKARRADFDALAGAIREIHSYELPEIVMTPILAGDAAYLGWMAEQTRR